MGEGLDESAGELAGVWGYGLWVKNLEVLFISRVTQVAVCMNHSCDFDNLIF